MTITKTKPPVEPAAKRVGYRDILGHLLAEIKASRWQVGEAIVSEADLVDRFGTTRTTVRQALKELETLGYIKRRRGTRSVLISLDPSEDFVNSVRSIGEMLQYSQRTRSQMLRVSEVKTDAALAEKLSVPSGEKWVLAEYLRNPMRGSLPLGYSQIYLPERYSGVVELLSDNHTVYTLLQEHFGIVISRVEQEIQAAAADARVAGLLKVDEGSPIMVVRTRFITGAGEAAEVGFGHFPAGRFRLEMVLERSVGDKLE